MIFFLPWASLPLFYGLGSFYLFLVEFFFFFFSSLLAATTNPDNKLQVFGVWLSKFCSRLWMGLRFLVLGPSVFLCSSQRAQHTQRRGKLHGCFLTHSFRGDIGALLHTFHFSECCGLNYVSSYQFLCRNPNPQCDGIWRWGLWQVVRSWGWSPHNGISALMRPDMAYLSSCLCVSL